MKYTINELANSKGVSQPVREALLQMEAELDATNRQVEILSDALAESRREVATLKVNAALDKKAENARELGLDYEPVGFIDRLTNPEQHYEFIDPKKANAVLMSLCQEAADALAAQQEHEPENEPHVSLASVREDWGPGPHEYHSLPSQPAPVQPVAWGVFEGGNLHDMFFTKEEADNMAHLKGLHAEIRPLTTPPAAPVQKPVAYLFTNVQSGDIEASINPDHKEGEREMWYREPLVRPPAAQPAVPDAMTSADIQEHIEYVAGWNDCRQAMLEMMK